MKAAMTPRMVASSQPAGNEVFGRAGVAGIVALADSVARGDGRMLAVAVVAVERADGATAVAGSLFPPATTAGCQAERYCRDHEHPCHHRATPFPQHAAINININRRAYRRAVRFPQRIPRSCAGLLGSGSLPISESRGCAIRPVGGQRRMAWHASGAS